MQSVSFFSLREKPIISIRCGLHQWKSIRISFVYLTPNTFLCDYVEWQLRFKNLNYQGCISLIDSKLLIKQYFDAFGNHKLWDSAHSDWFHSYSLPFMDTIVLNHTKELRAWAVFCFGMTLKLTIQSSKSRFVPQGVTLATNYQNRWLFN